MVRKWKGWLCNTWEPSIREKTTSSGAKVPEVVLVWVSKHKVQRHHEHVECKAPMMVLVFSYKHW